MGISDKTRKILWGQAGNRCAMCKCELVVSSSDLDPEAIVGDECHIVSRQPNGPRHEPGFPQGEIDLTGNLVLLCRTHHKQVDDQAQTFTAEILRRTKTDHENWVASKLNESEKEGPIRLRRTKEGIPSNLERLKTGNDLMAIVGNVYGYSFEHDEPKTSEEAALLGGFLQELQGWGEMWGDIEPAERTDVSFRFSSTVAELEHGGFLVFGAREIQRVEGGGNPSSPWPVAIIRVVRSDSPKIRTVRVEGD